jgi:zinc transporter ZupT
MKAAGWMIFLGDMLHNFIDGLTLGAAFMVSIGEGLRMTLPIACEEFPHELGDIAVLLSSGLTITQALIVNFLAACSCYLGFFIGAKLGLLIMEYIERLFGLFFRGIGRISSMDLCISWRNVCLYRISRYGK